MGRGGRRRVAMEGRRGRERGGKERSGQDLISQGLSQEEEGRGLSLS